MYSINIRSWRESAQCKRPSGDQYYPDAVDDVSAFGGSGAKWPPVLSTAIQGPDGCNLSEVFQKPTAEIWKDDNSRN